MFFVYVILATVILPLPVELGLILSPGTPALWLALVLGLGRVVGGIVVLYAGHEIGGKTEKWFHRWKWSTRLLDSSERLISERGYLGLYIIMSIPFMLDSLPLYVFSVLDKGHRYKVRWFALTNFFAGFTRAAIFLALMYLFGVGTFSSVLSI